MPKNGRSEEEILRGLHEVEAGENAIAVCRQHGISQQALYLWKQKDAGLGLRELRELRQLREENAKLKRLVADLSLDRHILQEALWFRLRELAASCVRFGDRRLTVLLRREGWAVYAKRIYRICTEEGLIVRTQVRRRAAQRQWVPQGPVRAPNQRWAMDSVHLWRIDGRGFRVLTVLDHGPRECLRLVADSGLSGQKVAAMLEPIVHYRSAPQAITVDNGSEFASRALEVWAYQQWWMCRSRQFRGSLNDRGRVQPAGCCPPDRSWRWSPGAS